MRKYHSHSPMQELAPLAGRPISTASSNARHAFTQDARDMDIDDPAPAQTTPGPVPLIDARTRTPLPSFGARVEKPLSMPPLALPKIDSIKTELEAAASRILSGPHKGRYNTVLVLLICWHDDEDLGMTTAVEELNEVFDKYYHYTSQIIRIQASLSDGYKSPERWLLRTINDFAENNDTREVLKVVYYNGGSYRDEAQGMLLTSSGDKGDKNLTIRWEGVQQILERARSDTLIMMDATYYPSSRMFRHEGVFELLAASASEEDYNLLGRNNFTRALAEQLRIRATQQVFNALSAGQLPYRIVSVYPTMIRDKHPKQERATIFPVPLYIQGSGNSRLPSITLSPLVQPVRPRTPLISPEAPTGHHQVTLSIRLTDEALNLESWTEWLRMMPEGIKDASLSGPYYRTF